MLIPIFLNHFFLSYSAKKKQQQKKTVKTAYFEDRFKLLMNNPLTFDDQGKGAGCNVALVICCCHGNINVVKDLDL